MKGGEAHHLLFTKKLWRTQDPTRELRNNHWLIPYIATDIHKELHRAVAVVPVLDHFTASRVERDFLPVPGDYLASIGNLMLSIDEAAHNPKTKIIERELGQLAIAAIELQLPFIKEGLMW